MGKKYIADELEGQLRGSIHSTVTASTQEASRSDNLVATTAFVNNEIARIGRGVTSVAQSHGGNAFSVSGSPVTSSGTLAISVVGNKSQYINGDGDLATFPGIPQGDITEVTGSGGLQGGGQSGSVTLSVDYSGAGNIIDTAADGTVVDLKDKMLYEDATDGIVKEINIVSILSLAPKQTLSIAGTTLSISGGNSIAVPTSIGPRGPKGDQGIQGIQGDTGSHREQKEIKV